MPDITYENFDLRIERSGTRYRARVLASPAGEDEANFQLKLAPLELRIFCCGSGVRVA